MKPLGIYVHLPFCTKKCGYCDFYSIRADEEMKQNYIKALIREIEGEPSSKYAEYQVRTIYFGGGTPSILDETLLEAVLNTVRRKFILSTEELEITIECNPATVTENKLTAYKTIGLNRVSIGLQSANNKELKLLGRIHTYEEFLESYRLVRKAEFLNVSVDIMSGLPSQTIDTFGRTLDEVIRLKPEHISCYSLILEEGTPFFKKYSDGKALKRLLPNEETERKMYYLTDEKLKKVGYQRYEISNYAKEGYHSRHNSSYWERVPYLGFGVAAASMFEGKRWNHIANIKEYIRRIESGESIAQDTVHLSLKNEMEETMFLGLRMDKGISKNEFFKTFKKDIYEVYGDVLNKYIKKELLCDAEGRIFLTKRGVDLGNMIFSEFLLE